MARDLNRLFDDIRRSRDVFVTQDGRIEDADESRDNRTAERSQTGTSQPRVSLKPEVFASGAREPLTVSLAVLDALHAEARRHAGETGGIVLGPRPRCLTEFIPSGSGAARTGSSYVLDPAHLQPLLDQAADRGLSFLGIWHSHPEGVPELSATDRATAKRMLADADYGLAELVLPLSARTATGFETRFFIIEASADTVQRPEVVLVADTVAPANGSASPITHVVGPVPWDFVNTPDGARRLKADQDDLTRAGFEAHTRRTKRGFAFFVSKQGIDIAFMFPPEYPVAAPIVVPRFADEPVELPAAAKRSLRRWSSRSRPVDVAKLIVKGEAPPASKQPGVLSRLGQAFGLTTSTEAP